MRTHQRCAAFTHQDWSTGAWLDMPDWRLDRAVIRLALYLRGPFAFTAGQTVAILAPLGWEWVVADLATITGGGVSAAIDPGLHDDALADAIAAASPEIVVVADSIDLQRVSRLRALGSDRRRAIVLDASASGEGVVAFSAALDLGGTLDTAERASAFRARARAAAPHAPAAAHVTVDGCGCVNVETLTQGELAGQVLAERTHLAGAAGPSMFTRLPDMRSRVLMYAALADGAVTAGIGAPVGGEAARGRLRGSWFLPDRRLPS